MPEVPKEVDVVMVDFMCEATPGCPGRMLPNGMVADNVRPILYMHECTICRVQEAYPKKFPYIKYVERKIITIPGGM